MCIHVCIIFKALHACAHVCVPFTYRAREAREDFSMCISTYTYTVEVLMVMYIRGCMCVCRSTCTCIDTCLLNAFVKCDHGRMSCKYMRVHGYMLGYTVMSMRSCTMAVACG